MQRRLVAALVVPLVLRFPSPASATTYYVSPSGSNANGGTDVSAPLNTIQYAAGLTAPGDTVLVMDGTYTNDAPGDNILLVEVSGTEAAPITFAAYPGQHPVLRFANSWAAIRIAANYIVVDGFEIVGNAAAVTPRYGLTHVRDWWSPLVNGDGIDVDDEAQGSVTHHVTIRNMVIHDVPGGGIAADGADYVSILGNVIYDTSHWSAYGDSGISLFESRDIDANTGTKNLIAYNTVFHNAELVPCLCRAYKSISDGNGIIVDDNLDQQGDGTPYGGRTLVAFNVSYGNGGSGIHAYASQHVDIVSNTAYDNNQTPALDEGEIFALASADINIIDDILVAPAGATINGGGNTGSVVEDYNLLFNIGGVSAPPILPGAHDILADPLFAEPADGNFSLLPSSPASRSGIGFAFPFPLPDVTAGAPDRGAE